MLTRTARVTGLFYLGLAVTGMVGFLLIRPQLVTAGDPAATLASLTTHEALARVGVAFELLIVITQALTAVWFQRLFRSANAPAAGLIAAFGLINAIVILISAGLLATAVQVAAEPFGDAAATVQLLYSISENLWGVGAVFFGLWLIPMGWCALRSGWMPRALGWLLVVSGVGYLLSAFTTYLAPNADLITNALTLPATVGEFWMIGYLLVRGVRPGATEAPATPTPLVATAG